MGFTPEEMTAIDELLDWLGIEEDDPAALPVSDPVSAETGTMGLDDTQAFLDSVHTSGIFGSELKPDQVKGLEAVLGAATKAGWPLAFSAYALATACHETAYTMQPVREAFCSARTGAATTCAITPFMGAATCSSPGSGITKRRIASWTLAEV